MRDFAYFNSDMFPSLSIPTDLTPTSRSMVDVIQKVMVDGFDNHTILKYKSVDNGKFIEVFCSSDVSSEMSKMVRVTIDSIDPLIKGEWIVWSSIGNVVALHKPSRETLVGYPTEYADTVGMIQVDHIKWQLVYRSANELVIRQPDYAGGACLGIKHDCGVVGIYQSDSATELKQTQWSTSPNKVYAQVYDFVTYETGKTFHQNVLENGRKLLQTAHPMYAYNAAHVSFRAVYPLWAIKPINQTKTYASNALWSIKVTKKNFTISLNSIWAANLYLDSSGFYGIEDNAIMKDCQILIGALPVYNYATNPESNLSNFQGMLGASSADSPVIRYGVPDNKYSCLFFYYSSTSQKVNSATATNIDNIGNYPNYYNSSVVGSIAYTFRQGDGNSTDFLIPIMKNPYMHFCGPYRYKVGYPNYVEVDNKIYQLFLISTDNNGGLNISTGHSGMYNVAIRALEI